MMNKFVFAMLAGVFASHLMAEEVSKIDNKIEWYETKTNSYVFIKKSSIQEDEKQPHLKTVVMAVNIPTAKDRKADPNKTLVNNEVELSYITDLTVNCVDKTSKIGSHFLYEGFFGKGRLLESSVADVNSPFLPLKSADGELIWEIVCQPKK